MGTAASAAPGWTVVPTVDPSAAGNVLNAVAVRGPADAWAVGHFTAPDQDDDGLNMLTEHWNGSAWIQVGAPAVLHQDESLLAVSASSASDAWAVGFTKTVGAAGASRWPRTGTGAAGGSCPPPPLPAVPSRPSTAWSP